ncbi:hypothetical protein AGMMS49928_13400 [Spirochaetia bacterium]|nr:hypothetical protein AGMMS49928_13400 [Spirochaetia bacterium]
MKRITILFLTSLVFTALCAPRHAEAQVPAETSVFRQEGIASWYGNQFNGRPTASGEIFNSSLYTAAHPNLPFGTLLLVTNVYNGRQVVVRVNDRGPFVAGRIIDLSRAAAERLDMLGTGTAPVVAEYTNMPIGYYGQTALPQSTPISPQSIPPAPQSIPAAPETAPSPYPVLTPEVPPIPPRPSAPPPAQLSQPVPVPQYVPPAPQSIPPAPQPAPAPIIQYVYVPVPQSIPSAPQSIPSAPQSIPPAPDIQPAPAPEPEIILVPMAPDYKAPEAPKAEPPKPSSTAAVIKPSIPSAGNGKIYRVQAGSFKVARNALEAFDRLKAVGLNPSYEKNGDMYRVVLAGVPSADIAITAEKMGAAGFKEALIREE